MYFRSEFLEILENYTFLETLGPTECEKQWLHFFQAFCGLYLKFSKCRLFFLKSGNISATDHTRHLILVPKYIEILPDFRKNSGHFENQRWLPYDARKKSVNIVFQVQ